MTQIQVNTPFGTRLFPTDLLFKNFFDRASAFQSNLEAKIHHPVDIILKEDGLVFEIAAVGLKKEDVDLQVEDGNCLKVSYSKPNIEANDSDIDAGEYIHKGIAKRSFNLELKYNPTIIPPVNRPTSPVSAVSITIFSLHVSCYNITSIIVSFVLNILRSTFSFIQHS